MQMSIKVDGEITTIVVSDDPEYDYQLIQTLFRAGFRPIRGESTDASKVTIIRGDWQDILIVAIAVKGGPNLGRYDLSD